MVLCLFKCDVKSSCTSDDWPGLVSESAVFLLLNILHLQISRKAATASVSFIIAVSQPGWYQFLCIYIHIYIYIWVCVCISTSLAPSICNRTIKAIRCSDAFGLRFVTTERLQHNHVSTATQFLADAWKKNCTRSELNLGLIVQICADVARRCQDISTARVFDLNKPVWPGIVSILYILWYSGMLLSLFVACQQKCQFHLDFAYDVIAYSNTHALYIYTYAHLCAYIHANTLALA